MFIAIGLNMFLIISQVSLADIHMYSSTVMFNVDLSVFPEMRALSDRVAAIGGVSKYLESQKTFFYRIGINER